jgi:hypothetical protein
MGHRVILMLWFGSDGFDRRRSFLHEIGILSIAWLLKLLAWLCHGVRTERHFWFVIAEGDVTPRLYLMKGESGNLQLPLSATISSSISSEIINLATEILFIKSS